MIPRRDVTLRCDVGTFPAATSRRTFLRQTGAGVVAASLPRTLRAGQADNALRIGLIGCGQRGRWFYERANYVCDPDRRRLAIAAEKAGVDSAHATTDLRHILDDKEIDAVVIAAPDHWHAPAAIMACEAGKHVYVEKPCSHNFREAQLLLEAARRNKVVVQHGTQQRSRAFTIEAIQMLRDGVIGDVLIAKAWNIQQRSNIGHVQPSAPPSEVDYDIWVGPAEMVPFQANRFHDHWHWWYNFGTGDIGNDGAHELDYARWGLGADTLPSKVVALGGKYFHDDDQQFPDTATCVFEYPGDGVTGSQKQLIFEMRLWSRNYPLNCDSGVEFFGTKGKMFLSKRGKLQVIGERNEVIVEKKVEKSSQPLEHLDDFLDAIRTGRRPNADILEAFHSVAPIHLANIALRVGRSLEFDPEKQAIVGDSAAQQLLSRTYRSDGHWATPQGV
ncbi:MAG: Gfo/Idh/MocA family oxidoreductase [Planctomycetales bacterium]|nr:Gfo/Idh/MocA family oxidoreductase [Planctomycetales bacterium]